MPQQIKPKGKLFIFSLTLKYRHCLQWNLCDCCSWCSMYLRRVLGEATERFYFHFNPFSIFNQNARCICVRKTAASHQDMLIQCATWR